MRINNIINKTLLAGHKLMPEMHLRLPGFTFSAFEPFIRNKTRTQKFEATGKSRYMYRNKTQKTRFQHDMVC